MKIANCNINSAIYVPVGGYLDGETLKEPLWARPGLHTLSAEFAATQEASGMLEIVSVDGHPVVWGSCCTDHS